MSKSPSKQPGDSDAAPPAATYVCTCQPTGTLTWCARHRVWKTAHWIHLCQTRPAYRAAWDAGRGPGQRHACDGQDGRAQFEMPPWLTCSHRGERTLAVPARDYGCGCGQIQFHECRRFNEPVVLKLKHEVKRALVGAVSGYTGRACNVCELYAASAGRESVGKKPTRRKE